MPLNVTYLRHRRTELCMTQHAAAMVAGLANRQKWSQYERGWIDNPSIATISAMAKAMRCPVSKLIREK